MNKKILSLSKKEIILFSIFLIIIGVVIFNLGLVIGKAERNPSKQADNIDIITKIQAPDDTVPLEFVTEEKINKTKKKKDTSEVKQDNIKKVDVQVKKDEKFYTAQVFATIFDSKAQNILQQLLENKFSAVINQYESDSQIIYRIRIRKNSLSNIEETVRKIRINLPDLGEPRIIELYN